MNTDMIMDYHNQTKHHPNHYAASLGYLDWANQPDPFRRYSHTSRIQLPFLKTEPDHDYEILFSPHTLPSTSISVESLGQYMELSMALSAWKESQGARWALRMNPSSGNLHPTECYVLLPTPCETLTAGVYHYCPLDHTLECLITYPEAISTLLQQAICHNGFFIMANGHSDIVIMMWVMLWGHYVFPHSYWDGR